MDLQDQQKTSCKINDALRNYRYWELEVGFIIKEKAEYRLRQLINKTHRDPPRYAWPGETREDTE